MLSPATDKMLTHVEAMVDEVSHAMLGADGMALEQVCTELREVTVAFSQVLARLPMEQLHDAALRARLKRIQGQLGNQRSGVARQAARVEHALHAIVPASRAATYGKARSPYGTGVTQTGAFKLLAA